MPLPLHLAIIQFCCQVHMYSSRDSLYINKEIVLTPNVQVFFFSFSFFCLGSNFFSTNSCFILFDSYSPPYLMDTYEVSNLFLLPAVFSWTLHIQQFIQMQLYTGFIEMKSLGSYCTSAILISTDRLP